METKFKVNDWVCEQGTDNYPKMKVMAITADGLYRCYGVSYRPRKKTIDKNFKEDELVAWHNPAGIVVLRDKSTFR